MARPGVSLRSSRQRLLRVSRASRGGGSGGLQPLPSLHPTFPPIPPSPKFPRSQVKSVSHDLEQLSRLLHLARSLIQNPFLCLGSYVCSLMGSVLYCVLEPLAASINPLNDHWTLRDYAAMLLGRIFWWGRGSRRGWGASRGSHRGLSARLCPQEPRGAGQGLVPADPALAPEGSGGSRAAALLPLRGRGGAARAGLEGQGGPRGFGGVPRGS